MNYADQAHTHWVLIKVYERGLGSDLIKVLKWDDMRFEIRHKWSWYFEYRAALEKVKHPRSLVDLKWGNQIAQGKSLLQLKEERIISRKREITRISNIIQKHETEQSKLLIWEKDRDMKYQNTLKKLDGLKEEYNSLKIEIENLKK